MKNALLNFRQNQTVPTHKPSQKRAPRIAALMSAVAIALCSPAKALSEIPPNTVTAVDQVPRQFSADALAYVQQHADDIYNVASSLSVLPEGIAGAIAREITRSNITKKTQLIHDFAAQWVDLQFAIFSDEAIYSRYLTAKSLPASDLANIAKDPAERAFYLALNDMGPGRIQIRTAIDALEYYNQTYKITDPLGLKIYNGKYKELYNDLIDESSPLTVKLTGLICQQAQKWYAAHMGSAWSNLSAQDQAALMVKYYTVGVERLTGTLVNGIYTPLLNGDGSDYYLFGNNPTYASDALAAKFGTYTMTETAMDGSMVTTKSMILPGIGVIDKVVTMSQGDVATSVFTNATNGIYKKEIVSFDRVTGTTGYTTTHYLGAAQQYIVTEKKLVSANGQETKLYEFSGEDLSNPFEYTRLLTRTDGSLVKSTQQWDTTTKAYLGRTEERVASAQADGSSLNQAPAKDFNEMYGYDEYPHDGTSQTDKLTLQEKIYWNDTTTSTKFDSTGQTIEGYNAARQHTSTTRINGDGSSESVVYNPANGKVTRRAVIGADGAKVIEYYDPNTGAWIYTGTLDKNGNLVRQSNARDVQFNQFVASVVDTLAAQAISQFLFKHHLPASLAAQAFSHASINAVTNVVNGQPVPSVEGFSASFATSFASMGAGIVGSEMGAKLFKDLGLPPELGSLTGSVLSQAAAQQLTAYIAQDVLGITEGVGGSLLNGTMSTDAFVGSLGTAFLNAGFSIAGSQLEQALFDNRVGPGSSIGGSLGTVIGAYATGPLAPLGAFIGSFLGSFIGGLFGGHPSVGPNATAWVEYLPTPHTFQLTQSGADNGGDIEIARNLSRTAASMLNAITATMGNPTVTSDPLPRYGLGYFKGRFFADDLLDGNPQEYEQNQYDRAQDAVNNAVFRILKASRLQGGDPFMAYALAFSPAPNLPALIPDLNAARDYSLYRANPAAFVASLAASGDQAQLQTWMAELDRVHALGLDQLTSTQLASLSTFGAVRGTITASMLQSEAGAVAAGNNFNLGGGKNYITRAANNTVMVWEFNGAGALVGSRQLFWEDGNPYLLDPSAQIVGAGPGFWREGGHALVIRKNDGQLTVTEFDDSLHTVNSYPLFWQDGKPYALDSSAKVIGTGLGFWREGGHDLIIRNPDGQVVVAEFGDNMRTVNNHPLFWQDGKPYALDPSATVLGTGLGFWREGGHDLIFRQSDGQVVVAEFGNDMRTVNHRALFWQDGKPYTINTTDSVVGAGLGFWRPGGHDLIIRKANGQLRVTEFGDDMRTVNSRDLAWEDGQSFALDPTEHVVATGLGFWRHGGHALISRKEDGQLRVTEFDDNLRTVNSYPLFWQDGQPYRLGPTDHVVATGLGFWHPGGHSLVIRQETGQLVVTEFDDARHTVNSRALSWQSGAPYTLDPTDHVIGVGLGFWREGGHALVIRKQTGQLMVTEFGQDMRTVNCRSLSWESGAPYTLDPTDTIVGTGLGFWGENRHDLILRKQTGQIAVTEFGNDMRTTNARWLSWESGQPYTLDPTDTVIATGLGFWRDQGTDLVIRKQTGQLAVTEFDATTFRTTDSRPLFWEGGQPYAIGPTDTVVATGTGFWRNGDADLVIRQETGQVVVTEFGSNYETTNSRALFWQSGAPYTIEPTAHVVGTGQGYGQAGQHDLVIRRENGQSIVTEFNDTLRTTASWVVADTSLPLTAFPLLAAAHPAEARSRGAPTTATFLQALVQNAPRFPRLTLSNISAPGAPGSPATTDTATHPLRPLTRRPPPQPQHATT